ncbi:WD40-repeat-containing domain protein [Phycomyces blakesleeanus]|uniref:WD40-repeat-containing domain protein n=1 Tax=Phycomyces blakesleeanus TaxID=4837 RepID=A0ABR3B645_PHYBL
MTLDKKLEGHSGCVNTLFWSSRGDKLVSGSDDAKAIIWFPQENYRKACSIETGHRANIFSAKFMPSTSDSILVTASADSEVRVFDINDGNNGGLKSTLRHVYYCHINSVKSIAIENGNPHEFLTCAEDGTVRHFDIRQPHKCTPTVSHSCPAPLLDYGQHFRLNSLALNQINPQYFAVGGMDAYVYLHDRRMVGNSGGGASRRPSIDASTRCIRRFKPRPSQNHSINLYVTSCKFSDYNGEEARNTFSHDENEITERELETRALPSSLRWKWIDKMYLPKFDTAGEFAGPASGSVSTSNNILQYRDSDSNDNDISQDDEEEDEEENDGDDEEFELSIDPSRPRFSEIIYHFSRRNRSYLENNTPILGSEKIYNGHCNIMTTKEVNFFGPKDEYIVSGSDDGFLFVWDKNTTEIVQILQGDQDTVNVIQGHPFLPHMAVSGIDNTIKIFTPTSGPFTTSARKEPRLKTSYSPSSRMFEKDAIVERNIETHLSEPLIVEDNLYMDAENFLHDDPSLAVFLAEVSRI